MDCFSSDFLEDYIKRSKLRSIEKLQKLELTEDELPIYSDLLCQTLEYSPKIYRKDMRKALCKKFSIDKDEEESRIGRLRRGSQASSQTLNFNIERRTSLDDLVEKRISHDGSSGKYKLSDIETKKTSQYEQLESMVRSLIVEIIHDVCESRQKLEKENLKKQMKQISIQREKKARSPFKKVSPINIPNENMKVLKVFIKQEPEVTTLIDIPFYSTFKTLEDVLRFLLEENRLHPKNISLYFFTEHTSKSASTFNEKNIELFIKENEDENEISLETKLEDLETCEVDLLMHNFQDLPEIKCLSYYSQKILKEGSSQSQSQRSRKNSSYYSQEEEIFKMRNNINSDNVDFVPEYKRFSNFKGSNPNGRTSKIL
jgi:hypothetical protein